jgi:cell pole-organizing protein PopZ
MNGARMNGVHAEPRMPDTSPYAAMAALDALAQGLAASAAARSIPQAPVAPAPMRSDPYGPATGALVPVSEPHPRHSGGIPPHVPAANSYESHPPVRTLEDAVAEMLKPLLQQWIADNMPRIIEKALRVEAASTVKRTQKPPGY